MNRKITPSLTALRGALRGGPSPWACAALSIALVALAARPAKAADTCAALAAFKLDGRIVSAEQVTPPYVTPKSGFGQTSETVTAPFCRVVGVLTPSPASEIKFELWLPDRGYSGRLAGVGNGGFAGSISYGPMARMLNRGYAVFSNDRGHEGQTADPAWVLNPERRTDFTYRGTHLATLVAKAIVARYYSRPADHSYWTGCSAGGGQGYIEARLFPDDFDGMILGHATPMTQKTRAAVVVNGRMDPSAMFSVYRILSRTPSLTEDKLTMVSRAAIAACGFTGSVKDGFVSNPGQCKFDPAQLICAQGQTSNCLTTGEVDAIKAAYAAGYWPGTEYYWNFFLIIGKMMQGKDADVMAIASSLGYPDTPADQDFLQGYAARGGKIIAYGGTSDPTSVVETKFAEEMIASRQKPGMTRAQAIAELAKFYRFFLMPGAEHCGRGAGPNTFSGPNQLDQPYRDADRDVVTALEDWVEKGRAPDFIVAAKYTHDGPTQPVVMTRPICAYPARAQWNGKGDASDYRNFRCVAPPSR